MRTALQAGRDEACDSFGPDVYWPLRQIYCSWPAALDLEEYGREYRESDEGQGMLNRRAFMTGIGVAAFAGAAHALEVDDDDAIRDILRRRVEVEKRTVGIAVCVVTPNRKRFVAWGRERLGDGPPVTSGTVFEIASITKVFTALLLANMVRQGQMGLDDPVARHLPGDFHLPVLNGRQITLADLATHTSGLPRFPPLSASSLSSFFEAIARFSLADFKTWLADFHPPRPAGAEWEYSNAGYALLGMALAHRGDRPFETLLQARVIDRMDLRDTTFSPTAAMRPRVAESHDPALKSVPPLDLGIFAAAGGLRSTPPIFRASPPRSCRARASASPPTNSFYSLFGAPRRRSAECRPSAGRCWTPRAARSSARTA